MKVRHAIKKGEGYQEYILSEKLLNIFSYAIFHTQENIHDWNMVL